MEARNLALTALTVLHFSLADPVPMVGGFLFLCYPLSWIRGRCKGCSADGVL